MTLSRPSSLSTTMIVPLSQNAAELGSNPSISSICMTDRSRLQKPGCQMFLDTAPSATGRHSRRRLKLDLSRSIAAKAGLVRWSGHPIGKEVLCERESASSDLLRVRHISASEYER